MASSAGSLSAATTDRVSVTPTSGVVATSTDLISFSVAAQLPLKLTATNFPSWKAQFNALLVGYDLKGYIDGTLLCPPRTLNGDTASAANPAYISWIRQDQLLLHAILASVSENIVPLIASSQNSKEAWMKLTNLYANNSRSRVMHLKDQLSSVRRHSKSVSEFLQHIKSIADELALIDTPLSNDDLVIHILRGLGSEFKEISAAIRARENPISFEELHDKLIAYETFLQQEESVRDTVPVSAYYTGRYNRVKNSPRFSNQFNRSGGTYRNNGRNKNSRFFNKNEGRNNSRDDPSHGVRMVCQLCDQTGHLAKTCYRFRDTRREPEVNLAEANRESGWIVDSGASHHVTNTLSNLSLHNDYEGPDELVIGNGAGLKISHTGSTTLHYPKSKIHLTNVLCAPNITKNLLSVSELCRSNQVSIEFFASYFVVKELRTGATILRGELSDGMYRLPSSLQYPVALVGERARTTVWHNRLGHPSSKILRHIIKTFMLPSSSESSLDNKLSCDACRCSKSHKLPFHSSTLVSRHPLDLIYSDVWGPASTLSTDGFRYYVIFIDHFTRYIWLYPLRQKSDVASVFEQFKPIVEKQFQQSIRTFYSDGGGEYIKLKNFFTLHGISHLTTPPHTPEHNGISERRHRHIVETGLSILHKAALPSEFWSYAFQTACYLINRLPTSTLDSQSPYHVLFGTPPNYLKLRTFGCLCYPLLRPYTNTKLDSRSRPCIFLGYSLTQSAYKCFDPSSKRLFISRHVVFEEHVFPYVTLTQSVSHPPVQPLMSVPLPVSVLPPLSSQVTSQLSSQSILSPSDANVLVNPTTSPNDPHSNLLPDNVPHHNPTHESSEHVTTQFQPTPLNRTHPMITRSRNNIYKPKQIHNLTIKHPLSPPIEPSGITQASTDPKWRAAMSDEINALLRNGTWELVPNNPSFNIVGCRWVYRIKRRSDGSIERYKARLVAKGFHQRPGLDFKETFSPVIKPTTIRTILSLALMRGWDLRQMDVNNAFLQGTLEDEVYMMQPPGYKDSTKPNHVCKLRKAIYGLKQAPRAWYNELSAFLIDHSFVNSKADNSLFIYSKHGTHMYVLIYVDDLIITGSDSTAVSKFIASLSHRFSVKDLGSLHYFLGIEVVPTQHGILLSQHKYIRDLLERHKMTDAKEVSTPMATGSTLTIHDGTAITNPKDFRSLIGGLQYLLITRPDIAFTVNKLSQFMHKPTITHWTAAKRLLRYLKSTIFHGLHLRRDTTSTLHAYSDADWAGNSDDRTSTSGFLIYIGANPISWSSRKQKSVARSSTESEYRAIATTSAELLWVQNLLQELAIHSTQSPVIHCDNISATYVCANPVFHSRMKHIAIDFHFVRELVKTNRLQVSHISTHDQLADLLTKPLSKQRVHQLRHKIGVSDGNSILRGRIKE